MTFYVDKADRLVHVRNLPTLTLLEKFVGAERKRGGLSFTDGSKNWTAEADERLAEIEGYRARPKTVTTNKEFQAELAVLAAGRKKRKS